MLLVVWEEEGVSKVPRCDKQPAQIIFFPISLVCYGKNSCSSNIAKINIQFSLSASWLKKKEASKQTNKNQWPDQPPQIYTHAIPVVNGHYPQIWQGFKFIDTQVPYVLCRGIFFDNLMSICKCMSTSLIGIYLQTICDHCWKAQKLHLRVRFSYSSTDSKTLRLNLPGYKVFRNLWKLFWGANYKRITVPLSNFDMSLLP